MSDEYEGLYPRVEIFDNEVDAMEHSAMRNPDGGLACGYGKFSISAEHLAALQAGKVLVINVFDEYALIMYVKEQAE